MARTWEEHFVDRHTAQGWRDAWLQLADYLAAALAHGEMELLAIRAPTGEMLSIDVFDDHVLVIVGDDIGSSKSVDEAARMVFLVLNEAWQVVHPAFLQTHAGVEKHDQLIQLEAGLGPPELLKDPCGRTAFVEEIA